MLTTLECLPCFLKQALFTARLASTSPARQKEIVHTVSRLLPDLDLRKTPPENAIQVYETIAAVSGCRDPFLQLKKASNRLALGLLPRLREILAAADDPLLDALRLAIAGNIIDYGTQHDFDINQSLEACLSRKPVINHYHGLRKDLKKAGRVLYLADNCGELVFDGLVLERLDNQVILAVKERPIINDALMEDALECGLGQWASIISNGTACPGTPLDLCSADFQEAAATADLIISKGQGNFETLSETRAPLYFLLTVKCEVVARHLSELAGMPAHSVSTHDLVLLRSPFWE